MLSEGVTAPDCSLPGVHGGELVLFDLYDHLRDVDAAVLLFAPASFVPTITPDLAAASRAEWTERDDVLTWAITPDGPFAHEAYAAERGIDCPLLTDRFGGTADAYGVTLDSFMGLSDVPDRAAFVLDGDWTVEFAWRAEEPLAVPAESPLVGVADALSELLGEAVAPPDVDYE